MLRSSESTMRAWRRETVGCSTRSGDSRERPIWCAPGSETLITTPSRVRRTSWMRPRPDPAGAVLIVPAGGASGDFAVGGSGAGGAAGFASAGLGAGGLGSAGLGAVLGLAEAAGAAGLAAARAAALTGGRLTVL